MAFLLLCLISLVCAREMIKDHEIHSYWNKGRDWADIYPDA